MAHTNQDRWSGLVDAKLRTTLVTRDNLIFNTRYEGSPKAGKVKIPVRDTEVEVKAYSKSAGIDPAAGTTTYLDLTIDQDEAVNELIDGFDAASVPDGIVADRLDSAGYSLGLSMDKKSINALESATGANISATKTACTASTAYKTVLEAKRTLSRNGVPSEGRLAHRGTGISGSADAGLQFHPPGRSVPGADPAGRGRSGGRFQRGGELQHGL